MYSGFTNASYYARANPSRCSGDDDVSVDDDVGLAALRPWCGI